MYCSRRTFSDAFLAKLALGEIYVCHIVLHGNGSVRAYLRALSAAYTGHLAGFPGHGPLVLVDTAHEHSHAAGTLVPEFDDVLRAGPDTCPAGRTFVLIHFRKPCIGIHSYRTELAGSHAIPAAQTSEWTSGVPAVESRLDTAGGISAVVIDLRAVLT